MATAGFIVILLEKAAGMSLREAPEGAIDWEATAAMVQAVGSVAAILASAALIWWQRALSRRDDLRSRLHITVYRLPEYDALVRAWRNVIIYRPSDLGDGVSVRARVKGAGSGISPTAAGLLSPEEWTGEWRAMLPVEDLNSETHRLRGELWVGAQRDGRMRMTIDIVRDWDNHVLARRCWRLRVRRSDRWA